MGQDHEAELYEILKQGQVGEDPPPLDPVELDRELQSPEDLSPVEKDVSTKSFSSRNLFVHHDTHPIVLDIKLMDQYGTDWFEWEPETLWREIMDDFRTPSISDHVKSKIQAVKTVHISDWCFNKWDVFCLVTQALNNNIPDFEIMRKPTVSQLFVSVDIMTMIRGDVPFGDQVQQWCAAALLTEGVTYAPRPIAFCQDEIIQFVEDQGTPVDPGPVKEKYRVVTGLPSNEVVLEENPVDIQVAKLLVARDYLEMRREQMKHQLRVLR